MTGIMDNQNSRKKSRRYDYLNKKGTVPTRHDYIETEYVNGVKDTSGAEVIRPLTPDEKAWLSQFIAETEHGNVNKSREIKRELKVRKALKSEWVKAKRKGNVEEMSQLEEKLEKVTSKIVRLRENCNNFYTTEEEASEIYERDNARRRDVYNNAKITDNLVLYDLNEYDKFSTEALDGIDPENSVNEHLSYIPVKRRRK